jgi:hypothetical protein
MSYEITSESYGRRLPKITATATSTDDLATLGTDWAEGSTCTISDTTYKLDKVKGWVDPGSAPSGGGGALVINLTWDGEASKYTSDKTFAEISAAFQEGKFVYARSTNGFVYMPTHINSTEIYFLHEAAGSDGLGGYLLTSDEMMITAEDSVTETFSQFTLTIAT